MEVKKMNNCLVKRVICFIYSRDIRELSELSRSIIAQKFDINECLLSRTFKKGTEMLLSEFLMKAKIARAQEMLRYNDNATIEEISDELGFLKVSTFRKNFTKHTFLLPSQYRLLKKK